MTALNGLSIVLATNEEVDAAAELLRAIGLEVNGEDGFVQVVTGGTTVSIMRGAMIDVPPHGGLLVQVTVEDVEAAVQRATGAGATLELGPTTTDWGTYSAYLSTPAGFTLELAAPGPS